MIDNAATTENAEIYWHKRGQDEGRAGCRATHGHMLHAAYEDGYHLALRLASKDEARGRVQGAVVVGLLVWVSWWLGRKR